MPPSPPATSARRLPTLRQALLAVGGGLALALSFPNLDLWPLALLGLVPLFWLAQGLRPLPALLAGWLYGLTLNLCLRYWLTVVMTSYGGLNWPLSILGLVLLEIYLSSYVAVLAALVSFLYRRGMSPLWTAPLIWAGLEWVRGWFFTGFPWLPLSAGLTSFPPLVQSAELWGATGLSALVVLMNALLARACPPPAFLALAPARETAAPAAGLAPPPDRRRLAAALAAVILLASGWLWGAWRMERVQEAAQAAPHLTVTVVQANIPLLDLWRPGNRTWIVRRHLELTAQAQAQAGERPWLVVWPESAAP
ncbi:MAG: hypothetical protein HY794_08995, partial [Desulfarculus sp.]|nr:hypothetical protein [Desulfarculus sp.]